MSDIRCGVCGSCYEEFRDRVLPDAIGFRPACECKSTIQSLRKEVIQLKFMFDKISLFSAKGKRIVVDDVTYVDQQELEMIFYKFHKDSKEPKDAINNDH